MLITVLCCICPSYERPTGCRYSAICNMEHFSEPPGRWKYLNSSFVPSGLEVTSHLDEWNVAHHAQGAKAQPIDSMAAGIHTYIVRHFSPRSYGLFGKGKEVIEWLMLFMLTSLHEKSWRQESRPVTKSAYAIIVLDVGSRPRYIVIWYTSGKSLYIYHRLLAARMQLGSACTCTLSRMQKYPVLFPNARKIWGSI